MRARFLVLLPCLLAPAAARAEDGPCSVPPPLAGPAGERVTVPDVRRLAAREAAEVLAREGLSVARLFDVRFETVYALGSVVQQRPVPGATVPYGSGIELRVM